MMRQNNKDHALDTAEIKSRSIKGVKWLFVMNAIGIPSAFLIALMLGRTGPEALGTYALVQILIGTISTFVVYGGQNVLSVFIPKINDSENRGRFVLTYFLILLTFMVFVLSFFGIFPSVFEFLIQRKFDMQNYTWFILLSVLIVATEVLANTASGLMLIKTTAISRQMMRIILLPVVIFLYIFNREILLNHGMTWIIGSFMIGYLIACLICVFGIRKENRFQMRFGLFLPSGFWPFSLATMTATIFTFLYGNFDRLAVLSLKDVAGLGMYQAVLSVVVLVEYVPNILQVVIVPTFASLLASNQKNDLHHAFVTLCRYSVLLISVVSLCVIGFSREIIGLFGKGYVDYAHLLVLFSLLSLIRAPAYPASAILISLQKNFFRFSQSLLQILAQTALTMMFMSSYGVLGIAGAKIVAGAASTISGIVYVIYGMGMAPQLPRSYVVSVFIGLAMAILRIWVVPPGLFGSIALTMMCIGIFLVKSRLRSADIQGLINVFIQPNSNIWGFIMKNKLIWFKKEKGE